MRLQTNLNQFGILMLCKSWGSTAPPVCLFLWVSEWSFTSRPTQYRSFWGWPFQAMHVHHIYARKSLTFRESLIVKVKLSVKVKLFLVLLWCTCQRCADPEIFESASVHRFWPKICCQSASAPREKYWICVRPHPHWISLPLVINT